MTLAYFKFFVRLEEPQIFITLRIVIFLWNQNSKNPFIRGIYANFFNCTFLWHERMCTVPKGARTSIENPLKNSGLLSVPDATTKISCKFS